MIREVSLQGTKLVGIDDYKAECNDPILYCGVSDGAWQKGRGRSTLTMFVRTLTTLSLLGHISRTSSPNVNSVS